MTNRIQTTVNDKGQLQLSVRDTQTKLDSANQNTADLQSKAQEQEAQHASIMEAADKEAQDTIDDVDKANNLV